MDDTPSGAGEGTLDYKILTRDTHDPITCIRASERLLIVVILQTAIYHVYDKRMYSTRIQSKAHP